MMYKDMYRYSVDELLKTKPTKLEGCIFGDTGTGHTMDINGVSVFAEYMDIKYCEDMVVIRFYSKLNELVATVHASRGSYIFVDIDFMVIRETYNSMNGRVKSAEERDLIGIK